MNLEYLGRLGIHTALDNNNEEMSTSKPSSFINVLVSCSDSNPHKRPLHFSSINREQAKARRATLGN